MRVFHFNATMFNRDKFWTAYRQAFGKVSQKTVDAIEFLLDGFERDWINLRQIAYAFATIKHETANTFLPITEYGSKSYFNKYNGRRDLGNTEPGDGYRFRGRGFVQITGRKNYSKYDIDDRPEAALEPVVAFRILTKGMFTGNFTGKKLSDYISGSKCDYKNARRIINGTDKAALIAGYATQFEKILKLSAAASTSGGPSTAEKSQTSTIDPFDNQQKLPPTDIVPETPPAGTTIEETTFEQDKDGGTATKVTTGQNVAVEKEVEIGFWQGIKLKVTGWFSTIGGMEGARRAAEDTQFLGLDGGTWRMLTYVALALGGALFLGYSIKWLWTTISKRWLTTALVKANSTPSNQVAAVPADQLAQYEKEGWIVIRRQ